MTSGSEPIFKFEITGENPNTFFIKLVNEKAEVLEKEHEKPNATITMSADLFTQLTSGQISAISAFMAGKLKVQGDMQLAMKLQSIFA